MSSINYAILRVEKLKSFSSIRSSVAHSWRLVETLNADSSRSNLNRYSVADPNAVYARIDDLLPRNRRRNAVLVLEYLITSSRNALDDEASIEYLNDALSWIGERHGDEKIAGWAVHMDETTPHLAVYVVPLDGRGALNASAFINGKKSLSDMQTDFARDVAERYGLKRGIKGSAATHIDIRKLYREIQLSLLSACISAEDFRTLSEPEGIQNSTLQDVQDGVIDRINNKIQSNIRELATRASMVTYYEIRDREQKISLQRIQAELDVEREQRLTLERKLNAMTLQVEREKEIVDPPYDSQSSERIKRLEECKRRIRELDIRGQNESTERYIRSAHEQLTAKSGEWDSIDWHAVDRKFLVTERQLTNEKFALLCLIASSPRFAGLSASERRERYQHHERQLTDSRFDQAVERGTYREVNTER